MNCFHGAQDRRGLARINEGLERCLRMGNLSLRDWSKQASFFCSMVGAMTFSFASLADSLLLVLIKLSDEMNC